MMERYLLTQAVELARQAHDSQVDKAGKPYIEHPLRVMKTLARVEDKIVAVLHDAIEDSDLTLEDLQRLGFPENIIDAIDAITKRANENYHNYLQRVMSNQISLRVKIADMKDNMDETRIPNPSEKDYRRLQKYQQTLPLLLQALERDGTILSNSHLYC
jgi:(p)ppGpp synthase/HD superfamily hydrolase